VFATSDAPPTEQARRQLFHLFPDGLEPGEWLELRCLGCSRTPALPGPRGYHSTITDLVDCALRDAAEGWDVFFGVGLRRCPDSLDIHACRHKARGLDHVARLPVAWADLDVKSKDEPDKPHESLTAVMAMLAESPLPPSLVVGSGTGAHAYWRFPDGPSADLERVVAINRAIKDRFSGDNAIDAARILRLAGTTNNKHGVPLPVRLLSL
jgi:hypothetical protein